MNLGNKCVIGFALLFICGCYEQEKQIKSWAENHSEKYFEKLIEKDAETRTYKVGKTLVQELEQVDRELEALSPMLEALPTLKIESSEEPLKAEVTAYRFYRDLFLDRFEKLIIVESESKRLESETLNRVRLCEDYFKDYIIPPVDVAAMASLGGGKSFEVYLSFTTAAGSSTITPNVDLSANRNLVEVLVDSLINKPIGDLFVTDEEKNSLKEAKRILLERFPNEEKRKQIALMQCQTMLNPALKKAKYQQEIIQKMLLRAQKSVKLLTASSIQSSIHLRKAIERQRKMNVTDLQVKRVQNEMFFRRGDVLAKFSQQADRKFFQLIPFLHQGDLSRSEELLKEAKAAVENFHNYLIEEDLPFFQSKARTLKNKIEKYELQFVALLESTL